MTNDIGFEARLDGPFERAIEQTTEALMERGFGILTTIDLKEAFAEKLGVDFRDYRILGACNPRLAHRAVTAHPEVGLLLPCNVTVEAEPDGGALVRITDPRAMFAVGDFEADEEMEAVVVEARQLLGEVADSLRAGGS